MQAFILAAGKGLRLGKDIPKCLLKVKGTNYTILSRLIRQLHEASCDEITIVTGYKHELIDKPYKELFLGEKRINTLYNQYWDNMEHGKSMEVAFLTKWQQGEDVFLVDGDTVFRNGFFTYMSKPGNLFSVIGVSHDTNIKDEAEVVVKSKESNAIQAIKPLREVVINQESIGRYAGVIYFKHDMAQEFYNFLKEVTYYNIENTNIKYEKVFNSFLVSDHYKNVMLPFSYLDYISGSVNINTDDDLIAAKLFLQNEYILHERGKS